MSVGMWQQRFTFLVFVDSVVSSHNRLINKTRNKTIYAMSKGLNLLGCRSWSSDWASKVRQRRILFCVKYKLTRDRTFISLIALHFSSLSSFIDFELAVGFTFSPHEEATAEFRVERFLSTLYDMTYRTKDWKCLAKIVSEDAIRVRSNSCLLII